MFQYNYNNIIISVLVILTLLGVALLANYYLIDFKYQKELRNEIPIQNVDTKVNKSVENHLALVSTDNFINNSIAPLPESNLLWGAYVGDQPNSLSNFETLVGKKLDLYADFESFDNNFPLWLSSSIGQEGKTLVIFWEPNFGYDKIIDGSQDDYIKQFAQDAKAYSYPIILVPFDEMNLNEEAWGYGQNNNTATKFITAWRHIHDLFEGISNVKFGLAYNNVSIPEIEGNLFSDYYPGDAYVDYIGLDGFSFNDDWKTFGQIFDRPMILLSSYDKPILIFSVAAGANEKKANWIIEGLGTHLKSYKNLVGFIWFNKNKEQNWLVDSDNSSLKAFRSILP